LGQAAGLSSFWLVVAGGAAGGAVYLGAAYLLRVRALYSLPRALLGQWRLRQLF
jgi:hypothetical protein